MSSISFTLSWDGNNLGPTWMNPDSLERLLFSAKHHINPELLKVSVDTIDHTDASDQEGKDNPAVTNYIFAPLLRERDTALKERQLAQKGFREIRVLLARIKEGTLSIEDVDLTEDHEWVTVNQPEDPEAEDYRKFYRNLPKEIGTEW